MTVTEATTVIIDRTSFTDYPVRTDVDGGRVVASLVCWHDKDRKAFLGQLRGVTIRTVELSGVVVRDQTHPHSIMITTRQAARYSESALASFAEVAAGLLEELRFGSDDEDSYVAGVKAIFSGEEF